MFEQVGPNFNLRPIATVCLSVLFTLIYSVPGRCDSFLVKPEKYEPGKVEVEIPADPTRATFLDIRGTNALSFKITYEDIFPQTWASAIDNANYTALFGTSGIPILNFSAGYQFNLGPIGVGLDLMIGQGTISSNLSGSSVELSFLKRGFAGSVILDGIFKNPWVIPYGEAQIFVIDYAESESSLSSKGTTKFTTAISAGALINLNEVEPDVARVSYISNGLKATFLDVHAIQYNSTKNSIDPEFKTGMEFGVGMKFIF